MGIFNRAISGPFSLNGDGSLELLQNTTPGRYDYFPQFNIPIVEEEENGLTYRYEYKNDTDVPTAKFTC